MIVVEMNFIIPNVIQYLKIGQEVVLDLSQPKPVPIQRNLNQRLTTQSETKL